MRVLYSLTFITSRNFYTTNFSPLFKIFTLIDFRLLNKIRRIKLVSKNQNRIIWWGDIEENLISALLFGETETEKQVIEIAACYKNCPYINLMTTVDNQLYAIFFLPKRQKWWIEYIEKNPSETFGFKNAKVIFLENVYYPKKLKLRIPENLTEISPCGANCNECPNMIKCSCCPATIFYKKPNQEKT